MSESFEIGNGLKKAQDSPRVDGVAEFFERLQVGVQFHDGDEADVDVLACGRARRSRQFAVSASMREPRTACHADVDSPSSRCGMGSSSPSLSWTCARKEALR